MKLSRVLLLFLFCSINQLALAQEAGSKLETAKRTFDEQKLEELRADSDFQYEVIKPDPKGAFQRFIERIQNWFARLFASEASQTIIDILFRLLLVVAFIYFVMKLAGVEISTVFKPNKAKKLDYEINEERLSDIDFEKEITLAIQSKQWRFAIRLIYLNSLKFLSDHSALEIKKGKTNREYVYELGNSPQVQDFERLSFIFDYTWYGHFEANSEITNRAQAYLSEISKRGGSREG